MNFYSLQVPVISERNQNFTKSFLLKKITVLLLTCLLASSAASAQKITLHERNASLKKIFNLIKKQCDCIFFYEKDILDKTAPVTINVKDADIREVLDHCLKGQQLSYIISGNNIGIKRKPARAENLNSLPMEPTLMPDEDSLIWGRVVDTLNIPKQGVTVTSIRRAHRDKIFTATNADGTFEIYGRKGDRLVFSSIGYRNVEMRFNGENDLHVTMKIAPIEIGDVVIADVSTNRRRIPFTDTIDMTHRTHLNLGQLLQGSIPGLTLQNSSQSQQTLQSISFEGGMTVAGSATPTIEALRAHYNQYQSMYASLQGLPTFESWINSFKGVPYIRFNYGTSVNNNGLVPQLRGVSGFNGNTSGMLIVIDGFPQEGFPANYPMTNIESVKVIKDPEELSKWGPKAAGGIIMITSKRARAGNLEVRYASNFYYSRAPRFNRNKMRLASSADILDYMKSASDSGFMVLGSKDYPYTGFNLNAAQRIFHNWQQEALTPEAFASQLDSLGQLNNESQLGMLQQNSFSQNQLLTISGGSNAWRFRAAGGYNTTRSSALGNYDRMLSLNMNNDFLLFKNKLRAQWLVNIARSTAKGGVGADFRSLQPYQLLVDPVSGQYIYDYSTFNPDANTAIKKYGYADQGVNLLEDARVNSQLSRSLMAQSRLNVDWELLPSLTWSTSFLYDLSSTKREDLKDVASSEVRQLMNEYGTPVFDMNGAVSGIDFHVPYGGIMRRSSLKSSGWNLRSALLFDKYFGKHHLAASLGAGGLGNVSRTPSYPVIYGYNKQTGQGQAVVLPSPDPTAGILNLFSLPDSYFSTTYGRMVYPHTLLNPGMGDTSISRGLNWNGRLSYSYDGTYMLNGKYNTSLEPNYGHDRPYTHLTNYSAEAAWRLSSMHFFRAPSWISNVMLSAGTEGISIPGLSTQIMASRTLQSNWNNYGVWVSGFNQAQQSGQTSYNVYEKLTIGLAEDRYTFEVGYNSLHINTAEGSEIKNYVSGNGRIRLRDGLLKLYAGYGYSLDGHPQTNIRASYDIARESWFRSRAISKLAVDFVLQNISSYQGMELMASTNAPMADGGFSMALNSNFGLLPPRVRNLEAHATLGMNDDRYILDLRFYQKNTAGLQNNIPVPTDPSTGLGTKVTYSEIENKGVELFLQIKAVQQKDFKYTITLNGAYNKNIAKNVPVVNFSPTVSYLTAYRNGYSTENVWSYQWAGLDTKGNPRIYDAKGQSTATPDSAVLASSLVYSGVTRPPFTGGLIQEWEYKGFFARATLVLNLGHVIREYLPAPSRIQDNSVLIRDRWRKPGDEAFTDIAAMANNAEEGSIRKLIIQNSTNSIMRADNIRLQEVQIGWQAPVGKLLQNYFIKDLMVSLQVQNVAVWRNNRLGVDPETVANTGQIGMPVPTQYSFSVNTRF